jgi:hypothetical protein
MYGESPKKISTEVTKERGIKISRESIYGFVREGLQEGYMVYNPPLDRLLTQDLQKFPNSARGDDANVKHDVRVVHAFGERASQVVSQAGAEITIKLIRDLVKQRGSDAEVHIAFGIGRTTCTGRNSVPAPRLGQGAKLVVRDRDAVDAQSVDTVAAYGVERRSEGARTRGDDSSTSVPFVPAAEHADPAAARQGRSRPRARVDIVITSFADCCDEHGYLPYLQRGSGGPERDAG